MNLHLGPLVFMLTGALCGSLVGALGGSLISLVAGGKPIRSFVSGILCCIWLNSPVSDQVPYMFRDGASFDPMFDIPYWLGNSIFCAILVVRAVLTQRTPAIQSNGP